MCAMYPIVIKSLSQSSSNKYVTIEQCGLELAFLEFVELDIGINKNCLITVSLQPDHLNKQ
jgi:hypothetical protein